MTHQGGTRMVMWGHCALCERGFELDVDGALPTHTHFEINQTDPYPIGFVPYLAGMTLREAVAYRGIWCACVGPVDGMPRWASCACAADIAHCRFVQRAAHIFARQLFDLISQRQEPPTHPT